MALIGTSSVPKIPIDFSLGHYEDPLGRAAAREIRDCYIDTLPGRLSSGVVRADPGYSALFTQSGVFADAIMLDDGIFWISGGSLYSTTLGFISPVNQGSVGLSSQRYKLVANDTHIVILNLDSTNTADDYYYTPGTLATIQSLDADYASYGKARDVTYKDGYFVFVTDDTVFHGDSSLTGTGLAFDPLSFDTLPVGFGQGVGIEDINGRLHVFLSNGTVFYQTANTTPFAFQRSVSQTLSIGLDDPMAKVVFDNRALILAKNAAGISEPYLLEGNAYESVSDPSVSLLTQDLNGRPQLSTYSANGHRFITVQSNNISGTPTECYVLDYTETRLRGYPVWHTRGDAGEGDQYPLKKFLNRQDYASTGTNLLYAAGVTPGGATDMTLYQLNFTNTTNTKKVFTIPYIRNDGKPIFIKTMGFKFSSNCGLVELFSSTDGGTFTSLGQYDLTSFDDKRAEWRQINRYSTDVIFKLHFNPIATTEELCLIEGYLET